MADDIDRLLSAQAGEDQGSDVDALLDARASSPDETPSVPAKSAPVVDLPWYKRVAQGVGDPLVGAGQLMQHIIPDAALNVARKGVSLAMTGGKSSDLIPSMSSGEMDQFVRGREGEYQGERKDAGQKGMDWWRVGGNIANPVSWLAPEGSGAGVVAAIGNGAKQGAFQALLQPVTDKGSFLYDKALQGVVGTAVGGTLGGALEGLRPVFRLAKDRLTGAFKGADEATQQAAAAKVTEDTLKAAGADPTKVDPNLYGAMKREVADALKVGAEPNPKIMANRADAASLPVPIDLTRGQAGRDAAQFSWEVNSGKLRGAGEPISDRLTKQNRQLIGNLDAIGAKDAPSTFDASKTLIDHIEGLDAKAKAAVDQAYSAVRDSAGRPALMDHQSFTDASRQALEHGQLTEYVPDIIKKQYNEISLGRLPLTVDIAQQLDRVWSAEQRAATGSAKQAIGELRKALNDAPVNDALGAESMEAYKAARSLAKQRFALMEANPAYKAVVEGVEPDKFFQKYVQGANASELGSLKQIVGPDNTAMLQNTFLGNLKKRAINGASDENGVFSQSAYNKVLQDPVQGPRLQELFKDAPDKLGTLYRIGRVAENIGAYPKGHGVNTSNTAPTAANIIRDVAKSEAGASLWNLAPFARPIREVQAQHAARKAVDEALNPGVTATALKAPPPSAQLSKLSDIAIRATAGAAASKSTSRRDE
jgi:hypothetical protein